MPKGNDGIGVTDSLLLGITNGPDGPVRTVQFQLKVGPWAWWTSTSPAEIQALFDWIKHVSPQLIDDWSQEIHEHCYPHAHDPAFSSWEEEQAELKAVTK